MRGSAARRPPPDPPDDSGGSSSSSTSIGPPTSSSRRDSSLLRPPPRRPRSNNIRSSCDHLHDASVPPGPPRRPRSISLLFALLGSSGPQTSAVLVVGPLDPNKDGGRRFQTDIDLASLAGDGLTVHGVKKLFVDAHRRTGAGGGKSEGTGYGGLDFDLVTEPDGEELTDEVLQTLTTVASTTNVKSLAVRRKRGSVSRMFDSLNNLGSILSGDQSTYEDGHLLEDEAELMSCWWQVSVFLHTGVCIKNWQARLLKYLSLAAIALFVTFLGMFFAAQKIFGAEAVLCGPDKHVKCGNCSELVWEDATSYAGRNNKKLVDRMQRVGGGWSWEELEEGAATSSVPTLWVHVCPYHIVAKVVPVGVVLFRRRWGGQKSACEHAATQFRSLRRRLTRGEKLNHVSTS